MSNAIRALVLGLSTLIPAYRGVSYADDILNVKPRAEVTQNANKNEEKEKLRKYAVENRYSPSITYLVRNPNQYVVDSKDLEIARGEPNTYFSLGIGQNPSTINALKDDKLMKQVKKYFLEHMDTDFSIGLSQNDFPIDEDVQKACRKKLDVSEVVGAEYFLTKKPSWKVADEDRKLARGNHNTGFARGLVQNEGYIPKGQPVPEIDKEIARKDPQSDFATVLSDKEGFLPDEKDITVTMDDKQGQDGLSNIQTGYSWNAAKKIKVEAKHIKVAINNVDSMWADGIAANASWKDINEEHRKVARENPESMYSEALVDNINFIPNENDKKFAKDHPETLYSRCIEKWLTVNISAEQFDSEVLKSKTPVLVDFWAPWCGPCRKVSPLVEEIGEEYAGKIKVVKINIDTYPELANQYELEGIPTLLFFNNGAVVNRIVGVVPKSDIVSSVESIIQHK